LSLVLLTAIQVLAMTIHQGGLSNNTESSVDAYLTTTSSATNQPKFITSAQQPNKFVRTRNLSKRLKSSKRTTKNSSQGWAAISNANDTDHSKIFYRHQHIFSRNSNRLLTLYCVFQI